MTKIRLEDIVNELELISDDGESFLNRNTGEIVHFSGDELEFTAAHPIGKADLPLWLKEKIRVAREVERSSDFRKLPMRSEVSETKLLRQYAATVHDPRMRDALEGSLNDHEVTSLKTIRVISSLNLGESWYAFKREAYRVIAMNWCEQNGILAQ